MNQPPHRHPPRAGPEAFQTYAIDSPLDTHWRRTTCAEIGCASRQHGWVTRLDTTKQEAQKWAWYIRKVQNRRYVESVDSAGLVVFTFHAGQACFADGRDAHAQAYLGVQPHRIKLERPEIYVARHGDWRRSSLLRRYERADQFVDDFHTHTDRITDVRARG